MQASYVLVVLIFYLSPTKTTSNINQNHFEHVGKSFKQPYSSASKSSGEVMGVDGLK